MNKTNKKSFYQIGFDAGLSYVKTGEDIVMIDDPEFYDGYIDAIWFSVVKTLYSKDGELNNE